MFRPSDFPCDIQTVACGCYGGNHQVYHPPLVVKASIAGVYLQAAQIEFEEAVRRRKEVAEKDCTEVGLAEKSKPAAGEKIRER